MGRGVPRHGKRPSEVPMRKALASIIVALTLLIVLTASL
jgi:hypothetical protein